MVQTACESSRHALCKDAGSAPETWRILIAAQQVLRSSRRLVTSGQVGEGLLRPCLMAGQQEPFEEMKQSALYFRAQTI